MLQKQSSRWVNIGFQFLAVVVALALTAILLLLSGTPPLQAYKQLTLGAFGSINNVSNVLIAWAPVMITTAGLLVTFAAGLWNIGIEGQIMLGAIFTTWVLRSFQDSTLSSTFIITLSIVAGMFGGMLWACLAGVLKTFGGVNEIFGGLGPSWRCIFERYSNFSE
jgi:ABC-type uncharacterized transport system permease subunit